LRKDDNAFLGVSDPQALPAAADRLRPEIIRKRLDYWTGVVGPQFSSKHRAAINLRRDYSLNPVECGRHFIFRPPFPLPKIFQPCCELGVFCLTADKIAPIFGVRKHQRRRGKLHRLLEKLEHGHPVLRVYGQSLVARRYEKFSTFLCLEIGVNRMKDLGLNKGLENLPHRRQKRVAATDRLAGFECLTLTCRSTSPFSSAWRSPSRSARPQ